MNTAGGTIPFTGCRHRANSLEAETSLWRTLMTVVVKLELIALERLAEINFDLPPLLYPYSSRRVELERAAVCP